MHIHAQTLIERVGGVVAGPKSSRTALAAGAVACKRRRDFEVRVRHQTAQQVPKPTLPAALQCAVWLPVAKRLQMAVIKYDPATRQARSGVQGAIADGTALNPQWCPCRTRGARVAFVGFGKGTRQPSLSSTGLYSSGTLLCITGLFLYLSMCAGRP